MKKFLLAILAVTVLFSACDKEEEFVDVDQLSDLTISAYNGFSGLTAVRQESGDLVFDIEFEYDVAATSSFNDVKFYYTLNKDFTDAEWATAVEEDDLGTSTTLEDNRVTLEIDIPADDNKYSFTIPAVEVSEGDVIRCYFRGYTKDLDGEKLKMYYSPVGNDTFDHDTFSQWTTITVK